MSLLKPALEHSWLLRPWVALAELSPADWLQWREQSKVGAGFRKLQDKLPQSKPLDESRWPLFRQLLFIGIIGVFGLFTVSDTGPIGLAVWALLAFCLLALFLFRPPVLSRMTSVDWLVLAFLASAIVSTAFSSYLSTSVIGMAKMLTFVAGYTIFRVASEQGRGPILILLGVLVAIGFGESLIGFYQHIKHIQPLATWSDPSVNAELQMDRIFGTLKPYNPNLLAGFLIPCFAAAAGLLLLFFRKNTWWISVLLAGVCLALLVALVWTGSRGGFLAIGVMLATMFAYVGHLIWYDDMLQRKWMKILWITVLVGSIAAAGLGVMSSEKIRHRIGSMFAMREDSSISYRLNVYNSVGRMIHDNPVVGIGPGNGTFKQVYGLYMVPGYNALGAYSVPLEITAEQGVIGLFIFLSLLLVLVIRTLLLFDNPLVSIEQKLLAGALLMGVLGSFTYGIFDTIWYRPAVNLLFWFMVAALARQTETSSLADVEPALAS